MSGAINGLGTLVLIADRVKIDDLDIAARNYEQIADDYFNTFSEALMDISNEVVHYSSPAELIDNIANHKQSLVFTIYGGSISRNRMALIPAICEAYNINYVGADCYARIICQDKHLSKRLILDGGLKTPKSIVFNGEDFAIDTLGLLKTPIVVKPLLEGSSIGITENSIFETRNEAFKWAKELHSLFQQPILFEEFVTGREVYCCISGDEQQINLMEIVEIKMRGREDFFEKNLYSMEIKHLSEDIYHEVLPLTILDLQTIDRVKKLFFRLGKMDYIRIDGKLTSEGEFVIIELTPDAYLGKDSAFAKAAEENKIAYPDLLRLIINNSLRNYQSQDSNEIKNSEVY